MSCQPLLLLLPPCMGAVAQAECRLRQGEAQLWPSLPLVPRFPTIPSLQPRLALAPQVRAQPRAADGPQAAALQVPGGLL